MKILNNVRWHKPNKQKGEDGFILDTNNFDLNENKQLKDENKQLKKENETLYKSLLLFKNTLLNIKSLSNKSRSKLAKDILAEIKGVEGNE